MAKHAKKSDHLQLVSGRKTATVEIPLPILGAFASIENSFFELCFDAGSQVVAAMMEQDREDLCGPLWKRDPDRNAGRAGTTQSEVSPWASAVFPSAGCGFGPKAVRRWSCRASLSLPIEIRSMITPSTPWPAAFRLASTPGALSRCSTATTMAVFPRAPRPRGPLTRRGPR